MHGAKKGLKDFIAPQGMFEDLGLKYVGPVDGHDVEAVEQALAAARNFGGPVIVHCMTEKGRGYAAAENHELDKLHQVRPGRRRQAAAGSWTSIFSEELCAVGGAAADDIVAITASMLEPTGLAPFAAAYPDRVFDVGIAEQHAVTSAAGLSFGGLHPVVAIYATFVNRAFDQTVMDVALHQAGGHVRARPGRRHRRRRRLPQRHVGPDDPRPGARAAAGRAPGRRAAARAVRRGGRDRGRPDRGPVPQGQRARRRCRRSTRPAGWTCCTGPAREDVLIVSFGAMAPVCLGAAALLADQEIGVTVVDPRWVSPVDPALAPLAARHKLVITVEDSSRAGGAGSGVARALRGRRGRRAAADHRAAQAVPRPRQAGRRPRRGRAQPRRRSPSGR